MKNSLQDNIINNFSRLRKSMEDNKKSNSLKTIKLFNKKFYGLTPLLFSLCLILMMPVVVWSASVTMTWNRNQEPDIAGYKIYYGTQSGQYNNSITVLDSATQPLQRSYTVPNLSEGITYYFALKTFDQAGQTSNYSVEASQTIPGSGGSYDIFDSRLFVMQQYRDLLGREGATEGIDYWQYLLDSGYLTRAQLINKFLCCPEGQRRMAAIIRLYIGCFNRMPQYVGLDYWYTKYLSGMTLPRIAESFVLCPEFISKYGNLDNTSFVILLYKNILWREPNPQGLDYWTALLDSKQLSRGDVVLKFIESDEFERKSFAGVYIIQLYSAMLKRMPVEEEFEHWYGLLNDGFPPNEIVIVLLESPEYLNRFLSVP